MRTLTLALTFTLASCASTPHQTVVSGPSSAPEVLAQSLTVHDFTPSPTTTEKSEKVREESPVPVPTRATSPTTPMPRLVECGGWGGVMAAHFGNAAIAACSVASCESQFNPRALNASSGAAGLFQVMPLWADDYQRVTGVPYYDGRFDGTANIRFAAWLYGQSGWGPWVCQP